MKSCKKCMNYNNRERWCKENKHSVVVTARANTCKNYETNWLWRLIERYRT